MRAMCLSALLFLVLLFASAAAEEATLSFPCDAELSPFLSVSEHKITQVRDIKEYHRMAMDYWGDETMMVESGSIIILDDQFMMINLRFSKDFDYEADETYLPDEILLTNYNLEEPYSSSPTDKWREWRVMMYPDEDDPYSFHYIGLWDPHSIHSVHFYGSATTPEGTYGCFSLVVDTDLCAICFADQEHPSFSFPCDAELSPFLSVSEHKIVKQFDLNLWHRMSMDYWGDEPMKVESGSLLILDYQFVIINLRFSKDFDYEAQETHVPDEIMLVNHNLSVVYDTDPPEWRVTMYPDEDDPYSFHYIGTWNDTMYATYFYGFYTDSDDVCHDVFSLSAEM